MLIPTTYAVQVIAITMQQQTNDLEECDSTAHSKHFIGFLDRSVILTYIGIAFSVVGICIVFCGDIKWSLICLISAGICDVLDGTVARACGRRTDEEKMYGIQIDSLADAVSFVALPAAIMFGMGHTDVVSIAVCVFFVLAGLIRLAHFNVMASISEQDSFTGLPVTSSCVLIPLLWLLSRYLDGIAMGAIADVALVLTAILFVSRIQIRKPSATAKIVLGAAGIIGIAIIICI